VTGGALSPNTDNNNEESSWSSSSEPFPFSFLVLYIPLVPHERDVGENDRALQMWWTGKWMGAAWALLFFVCSMDMDMD
jgi:hypothetical protein